MPAIKPTSLRDLKARVNLVEVVSRVVTLRKVGSRFKGLCPFHHEKTPSFYVDPDKGFYKCFGCGKAGDVITFVRETEQLNFTEAVETLASASACRSNTRRAPAPPARSARCARSCTTSTSMAADYFHETFKGPGAAGEFMRAYWTDQRRFPPELADEFKIGAADPDGGGLAAALLRRKYSEDALRQCGLFFVRGRRAADRSARSGPRFRGRLMIPIRDHQGRVVAFTARQTELTPADDPAREAKYVNSPETPIFTKGNLLFNLDRARQPSARAGRSSWSRASSTPCAAGRSASRPPWRRRAPRSPTASWRCCAATSRRWSASSTATAPARRPRCGSCRWRSRPASRCSSSSLQTRQDRSGLAVSRAGPAGLRRDPPPGAVERMAFACRACCPSRRRRRRSRNPAPRRRSSAW